MRFNRLWGLVTGLAAGGLILAACGSSSSTGASSTGAPINIGTFAALSGPYASIGADAYGVQAYFDQVNAAGGINGHHINVTVGNDQFNPALTPGVASALVGQDHVQMLCGAFGSNDNAAIAPYLKSVKVPDVAMGTGTPTLVKPASDYAYEVVPPYEPLTASLVRYAVTVLHKKKIAIAYSNDDAGIPAFAGAKWELQKLGLKLATSVQFTMTATSLAPQAAKLKASGADFVIMWGLAENDALFVNDASAIGYHPTWGGAFFGALPTYIQLTHGSTSHHAYFVSPFTSATTSASAGYRAAIKKYEPSTATNDTNTMQGWTLADACGAVLKGATANGHDATFASITAAANHLTLNDAYVHNLKWTATDHLGVSVAQIIEQKGSNFVAVTPFQKMPNAPLKAG